MTPARRALVTSALGAGIAYSNLAVALPLLVLGAHRRLHRAPPDARRLARGEHPSQLRRRRVGRSPRGAHSRRVAPVHDAHGADTAPAAGTVARLRAPASRSPARRGDGDAAEPR